jgi:hypothetical protein
MIPGKTAGSDRCACVHFTLHRRFLPMGLFRMHGYETYWTIDLLTRKNTHFPEENQSIVVSFRANAPCICPEHASPRCLAHPRKPECRGCRKMNCPAIAQFVENLATICYYYSSINQLEAGAKSAILKR